MEIINNHVQEALSRLIEQYKDSDNLKVVLNAILQDIQDLEDSTHTLYGRLDIATAEGPLLDQIGEIVGQDRLGYGDEFYRTLIYTRIGINLSNGEPERAINIFKILSGANIVHLQEYYDANIGIGSDGVLPVDQLVFIYELIQSVIPAGVRLAHLWYFDPDCQFGFGGSQTGIQGFGSVNDANLGGCLGGLYDISKEFAFDGDDSNADGFSSVRDSVLGGKLVSV